MSSRANLLPTLITPTPPPQGGGGGVGVSRLDLPIIADPVVMQMRPAMAPVAAFVIAADGTGDFSTFSEAFAAVPEARSIAMAVAGASEANPRLRVDFGVKPGLYTDRPTIAAPAHTAFYALDPTPGATTLDWGIGTPDAAAGCIYWEGINIYNPSPTFDPKYPIHHVNHGTNIFTRCTLWNNGTGAGGGKTAIGMDGVDNGTLVLHDVIFRDGGTNLHGSPSPQKSRPETVVLSRVRVTDATFDITMGYNALNDVVADDIWLVDTHAAYLEVHGAATRMHVSGCTGTVRHRAQDGTDLGITDTRSDWPIPTGGLSAHDKQKWGMT